MGLDRLRHCLKDNEDAMQLLLLLREVSHTWDDLVDGDVAIGPEQVHRAFWIAVVGLRINPFMQKYEAVLLPVLETGILNFVASCTLERTSGHSRQLAHTARYQVADVALVMARLVGGLDWAIAVAPELKLLLQVDRYEDYDKEMEQRYAS